jgi:hypothetical protein
MMYKDDIVKTIERLESEKRRAEERYSHSHSQESIDSIALFTRQIEQWKNVLPHGRYRKELKPADMAELTMRTGRTSIDVRARKRSNKRYFNF